MKKVLIYTSIGVALAIILFFAVAFFGNPISKRELSTILKMRNMS